MLDQFTKENDRNKKKETCFCISIAKMMHDQCTKENVLSRVCVSLCVVCACVSLCVVCVASTQNLCLLAGLFLRRAKHHRVSKDTHRVSKETHRVSKET
jgi:hypothetical protein